MIFIETEFRRADGYVLMRAGGEIDLETAPRLAQELDAAAAEDPMLAVVVDLREVRFLSAAGVHCLAEWVAAPGDRIRLVCDDQSPASAVLHALGLHRRWPIDAEVGMRRHRSNPCERRSSSVGVIDVCGREDAG